MCKLAQKGQKKDTQAPALGTTTMDGYVMERWERGNTRWRDGRKGELRGSYTVEKVEMETGQQ